MTNDNAFRALDQIRRMCDEHASPRFKAVVRTRSRKSLTKLPTTRQMMREFRIAIAYSQGARSS